MTTPCVLFRGRFAPVAALLASAALTGLTAHSAHAAPADGSYRIVSACGSENVLEVLGGGTASGARAKLWSWEGEEHQKWRLESLADGTHRLVAVHSGKVLDAPMQAMEDGTPVLQQSEWNESTRQRFELSDAGSGWWRLTLQQTQTLVTVRGASSADGASIRLEPPADDCSQKWKFERLDPALAPVAVLIVAGASQSAVAGTTVPVRPALKVLDANGRPVSAVPVTFRVLSGGATLTDASTSTDSQGIASVGSWKLDSTIGIQKLAASAEGLPEAVFSADATAPGDTGTLHLTPDTDSQSATINTAVPYAPALTVRNANGAPVAGVTVRFAVSAGSGTLRMSSDVSDSNGLVSAGAWTLGAEVGTQAVTASASGYASAVFDATALAASAPNFTRSVFMRGVYEVWDMAFTPDGAMLFSERGRGLAVRLANGTVRRLFKPADMVAEGHSGMLGIAIDPAFSSNRRIYVYMASNRSGVRDTRVVRLTVNSAYSAVANRSDIVTGISYQHGAEFRGRHPGGDLEFGADGRLYISTGDTRTGGVPQNLRQLGAKVLRVDTSGRAAPGNNAPSGADPRIYAWGFRNPEGLAMRPGGGAYLIEHGPGYDDEVTRLRAGGNGGWDPRPRPLGSSSATCPDGSRYDYCGYRGARMTNTTLFAGAMLPAWRSGSPSRGSAGGDFLNGSAWGSWNGALVIAQLSGRRLLVLQLNSSGTAVTAQTPLLASFGTRLRTAVRGRDGALYVATASDNNVNSTATEIWRLAPR